MGISPRQVRTSRTDPIRIAWLDENPPGSLVGLTFAPGKRCDSTDGFRWERDVDLDLAVLVAERTAALVCLLEDHELEPNGLAELVPRARNVGLEVLRLPIRDVSVPDDMARLEELLGAIDDRVSAGARVVIHCLGGLGRTGTVAGCFLVRHGMTADEALVVLRRARGHRCPETATQRSFIAKYAARFIEDRSARAKATIDRTGRRLPEDRGASSWYALEPKILADVDALAEIARTTASANERKDRALVARVEAEVARAPDKCFSFDAAGTARLQARDWTFDAGRFSIPSLTELRERIVRRPRGASGRVRLSILHGAHALTDIGTLQATAPQGVLFQVASQFDCLEAPGARIVPVRDYLHDNTQGPRASISALPGTLLRHYQAPAADGHRFVQRDDRCLNLLDAVFDDSIAAVRSGYLRATDIHDTAALAAALTENFERVRVGVHDDVEVVFGHDWDGPVANPRQRIAQVFTSTIALGGYSRDDGSPALATVRQQLLRAAYLGTLLAAVALKKDTVVLTLIGGGAFGNPREEIWDAIRRAVGEIDDVADGEMHVLVNTREPLEEIDRAAVRARGGFVAEFGRGGVRVT